MHAPLFQEGKRDVPNILQNSIISLDEIHRCARGGQAISRRDQRLGGASQRQAVLHLMPDIRFRNGWI
jgi:hypothetical protein